MKTKEHLLALFEKNKGTYFSGEEIAAALSVSRAAVWKAVQSLRREGYEIDAVPIKATASPRRQIFFPRRESGNILNRPALA